MKKYIIALLCIVTLMFAGCNYTAIDLVYEFDYAYILLPNGEIIEGNVEAWTDHADGDQLRIVIDGTTYLTDTTRAVLIKKK